MKMTWSNLTCLGGVNTFWVVLSCDSRPQPQTEITDFAALPYRAGEPLSFFLKSENSTCWTRTYDLSNVSPRTLQDGRGRPVP